MVAAPQRAPLLGGSRRRQARAVRWRAEPAPYGLTGFSEKKLALVAAGWALPDAIDWSDTGGGFPRAIAGRFLSPDLSGTRRNLTWFADARR